MGRIAQEVDASATTFGQSPAVGDAFALEAEEAPAVGAAGSAVRRVAREVYATRVADRLATGTGAGAVDAGGACRARVCARAAMVGVGTQVDAQLTRVAGFTSTRGIETIDPRGDAVDRFVCERNPDRHLRAAPGATKLVDEIGARGIAGNHAHLPVAECGRLAIELQLERARLQVEPSGAVVRAVAARIHASPLEDL